MSIRAVQHPAAGLGSLHELSKPQQVSDGLPRRQALQYVCSFRKLTFDIVARGTCFGDAILGGKRRR